MAKKITQNINKDAGLMDLPKVKVPHSRWETKHSNYLTCNIGDIVPIYVDEVLPSEKRKVTMGQLSHMTTPIAPIFNSQYTEFRSFFVPYRLCVDLLAGYKTRKSPWVKVFGEDNASASADIVVPLAQQKLPSIPTGTDNDIVDDFYGNLNAEGGIADVLDYCDGLETSGLFTKYNFLSMAGYELIYQKAYRNENRESATESGLYKWLYNLYNRTTASVAYVDDFHKANREKDYFTGSQPFTQKGGSVSAGLAGEAVVKWRANSPGFSITNGKIVVGDTISDGAVQGEIDEASVISEGAVTTPINGKIQLFADLKSASGVNIEQLRVMIKTQELLEKDMMYGSRYAESLNAHFGCAPLSLQLEEPLELKKFVVASQMQPIFQTSSTASESTILGTIGANATTQSGTFEIVPETMFKEHGLLIICAVHKAQNSYDAMSYKPKLNFKHSRFDFFTPELNDLGYQPINRYEFSPDDVIDNFDEAVSYNEAWADYRFKFNKVHGMFEPGRDEALDYWTLSVSGVGDLQSLYKQSETELNRAISVNSSVAPQFYDAYGFIEINEKPMSLHSIPGMDGVI